MCAPATTATDVDDAERWAAALEDAWRALAAHPDAIALALDPDVASFDPYAAFAGVDAPAQLAIVVRNPIERAADVAYRVLVPEGWRGEPAAGTLRLRPLEAGRIPVTLTAPESAEPRRYVITVDVTIDGLRLGEAAEALVCVEARPRP